jgi:Transposase DDE domain
MMRVLSKPSSAQCNLNLYTLFLLAEPKSVSCQRLAQILETLSHDSVNRFLLRERYTPEDLFEVVKPRIELQGGTLSGDDTVLDKPYSDPSKTTLIDYFWSGKHKKVVKGINLITVYYTDPNGVSVPVNYRVNDKRDGKTKHDYFREMVLEVMAWGLMPGIITADSWYACVETLTLLKHQEWGFLFAIESNRLVSVEVSQEYRQVCHLEIPSTGRIVYLKQVGLVKVFRTVFKNEFRHYIVFVPDSTTLESFPESEFKRLHDHHWGIEQFHRAVKQVCNIERFFVRDHNAIHTHIFSALRAFVQLEFKRAAGDILNWYQVKRNLFNPLISAFIQDHLAEMANT